MSRREPKRAGREPAESGSRRRPAPKPPPAPVNQPDGTGDPSEPPQGEKLEPSNVTRKHKP